MTKDARIQTRWQRIVGRRRPRAPYANLIAFKQRQLREEPGNLRLRHSLAAQLGRAGRYPEAIEECERILADAPSFTGAKRLLIGLRVRRLFGLRLR